MKVYLTALIKSKPQYNQEVLDVLQNMVASSRKELACLQYDLHQDNDDKNTFIFYEIWNSEAELAQHNGQSYIKAFSNIVAEKLEQAPIIHKMSIL